MGLAAKRRENTQKEELGECGVEEGRCGQRSVGLEKRRWVNEREEGLSGLRMR